MKQELPDTATQFSRQARAYADSPTHASDADLDIVADYACPDKDDLCLDIACGPGHTAFRIATQARFVIAADIAPGMIETVQRLARERGVTNVLPQFASAEALPFADGSFDLVTCRIAPHHFTDVPQFVAEAARVLKSDGRLVLEDSLAPDDPALATFLEDLEKRRDHTHVHSLNRREWQAAIEDAGLAIVRETVFAKTHPFDSWLRRTGLDESQIAAIKKDALAAPAPVHAVFFDISGEQIHHFHDKKLIIRAEKHDS